MTKEPRQIKVEKDSATQKSVGGDMKSLLSVKTAQTSFKTPNVVVTDFKFSPSETGETFVHPILGTHDVHNMYELDWEGLKFAQMQEWSDICQDHYEAVVKLG